MTVSHCCIPIWGGKAPERPWRDPGRRSCARVLCLRRTGSGRQPDSWPCPFPRPRLTTPEPYRPAGKAHYDPLGTSRQRRDSRRRRRTEADAARRRVFDHARPHRTDEHPPQRVGGGAGATVLRCRREPHGAAHADRRPRHGVHPARRARPSARNRGRDRCRTRAGGRRLGQGSDGPSPRGHARRSARHPRARRRRRRDRCRQGRLGWRSSSTSTTARKR